MKTPEEIALELASYAYAEGGGYDEPIRVDTTELVERIAAAIRTEREAREKAEPSGRMTLHHPSFAVAIQSSVMGFGGVSIFPAVGLIVAVRA